VSWQKVKVKKFAFGFIQKFFQGLGISDEPYPLRFLSSFCLYYFQRLL